MDRRSFVGGVALGFVVAPFSVHAQQAAKVARVGLLTGLPLESPESQVLLDAFRQGLRELGYVEGQNIVIEYRSAGWKFERLPDLANEFVRLKVDVIAVGSTQVARAVRQVTTTVPISRRPWAIRSRTGLWRALRVPVETSPASPIWARSWSSSAWNCSRPCSPRFPG